MTGTQSVPIKKLKKAFARLSELPALFPGLHAVAVGLFLTVLLTIWSYQSARRDDELRFERRTSEAIIQIESRLFLYTSLLDQTRALFSIEPRLSEADFVSFVDGLQLRKNYSGIQAIGWLKRVRAHEVTSLEKKRVLEGRRDFHVWPQPHARDLQLSAGEGEDSVTVGTESRERFITSYIAPFDSRNKRALGLDMFTEPRRRAAAMKARDTGQSAVSQVLTLVQEDVASPRPGFLIFVPVYRKGFDASNSSVEQRQQNLAGWVYGAFRSQDVFGADIKKAITTNGLVDVEIFDGLPDRLSEDPVGNSGERFSTASLLFDSDAELDRVPSQKGLEGYYRKWRFGFTRQATVFISGRPWTISFHALPGFANRSGGQFVWFALLGGLFLTSCFYKLTLAANRYNLKISRREKQLRLVTDILPALVAYIDPSGRYRFANAAHLDWFGLEPEEVIGRKSESLLGASLAPWDRASLENALAGKRSAFESTLTHKSRGLVPVKIECRPDLNELDEISGFVVLATDISELRQLTDKLMREKRALELLNRFIVESNTSDPSVPLTRHLQNAVETAVEIYDAEFGILRVKNITTLAGPLVDLFSGPDDPRIDKLFDPAKAPFAVKKPEIFSRVDIQTLPFCRSLAVAPLGAKTGWILIGHKIPDFFAECELTNLQSLAAQAGLKNDFPLHPSEG